MTDQTRADFESHFGLTTRQKWQHKDGSYHFPEIQAKWEGWQKALETVQAAPIAPIKTWQERAAELPSYPTPEQAYQLLQGEIDELRTALAATPAPTAPSERKPVAWAVWMSFDGEMRPTDPVFFTEEGAQRQQATYGGEIVPLYR